MKRNRYTCFLIRLPGTLFVAFWFVFSAAPAHADHSHGDLHFSHPLVAESVSPDTKLRLDYLFGDDVDDASQHTVQLEGEYAFWPSLSIEVDVPYTFRDSSSESNENNLDNVEVALKYANFTFQDKGVLLGGGIELGLPTGDDSKGIGSNNIVEVEPFLDFGYMYERLETIGFVSFGIPTNTNGADEADVEIGWNLSFLYHVSTRLEVLVELDGQVVSGGEEDGFTVVNLDPGIKVAPVPRIPLKVGAGFRIPLTDDKEFDIASLVSVFWHF